MSNPFTNSQKASKNGVLQPLLVRPIKEGYELVCGERRLRACKLINLKSASVQIKNLNDLEALEAQIIENLEREDVHPLREAETFKLMINKGNYLIEDMATKMVKPEKFILQRLSLNNLNAEWKKLFLRIKLIFQRHLSLRDWTRNIKKR